MIDSSSLPHWLWPGDDQPPEEIDDEIAEELRFHLDMLAEQGEREGLETETAKQRAAERFGDFDQIQRRCRAEKQGDIPMLKRLQTALTVVLLLMVMFLGVRDYVSANTSAQYMTQTTQFLQTIQEDIAGLHKSCEAARANPQQAAASIRMRVS